MKSSIERAAPRMRALLLWPLLLCFANSVLVDAATLPAVSQTISGLAYPVAVAVDSYGNVYVADQNNSLVRKFAPSTSGAYAPAADLVNFGVGYSLQGLAVDPNNNVYVLNGSTVSVLTPMGNELTGQVIIPAPPIPASDSYVSLAVDGQRNVYVSDYKGIQKYTLSNSTYTLQQSVPVDRVASSIAVDPAGNIYVADTSSIRRYAVAGSGYSSPVTIDSIHANSIAVDQSGTVYALVLSTNNVIHRYALSGTTYTELSPVAQGNDLLHPNAIGVDAFGSVYVTDATRFSIEKFSRAGNAYQRQIDVASAGSIAHPVGMTFDRNGNLYIADTAQDSRSGAVHKFSPSNSGYLQLEDVVPKDLYFPRSIAVDSSNNVYVTETLDPNYGQKAVHKYMPSGASYTKSADLANDSYFSGVAVDGGDNVYVLDYDNGGIRKYSPSGARLEDVAKAGVLTRPTGLTIDAAGNVFAVSSGSTAPLGWTEFSPSAGGYIQQPQQMLPQCCSGISSMPIDASNTIYVTNDGSGVAVFATKDAGQATVMTENLWNWVYRSSAITDLAQITGIAFDASGNLYAGSLGNNSILVAHPEPHTSATFIGVQPATIHEPYYSFGINIAGNAPLGTVSVAVDNTTLCSQIPLAPTENEPNYVNVQCNFIDDALVATGIHTFTASYSGDDNNAASSDSVTGYYNSTVSDPTSLPIPLSAINLNQHGLTGSWYDPQTSGQGLVLEVYPNFTGSGQGILAAGWYTWDATASGGQRWYTLQGAVTNTATSATLMIYAGSGGNFAAPPIVPVIPVGTATLTFDTCASGKLTYSFNDGRTGTIPLSRALLNVTCGIAGDNANAPLSYALSGAWYDPSTSGQGVFFDLNPMQTTFFSGWFSYVPHGAQIAGIASQHWYVIQDNSFAADATSKDGMGIYEPAGGTFTTAGGVSSPQVGMAGIRFQNCGSAMLDYAFTSGTNAGLSGSIPLQRVGPTPAGCNL